MSTFNDPDLFLLDKCLKGNRESLEELILNFQNKIFTLSHQFLWNVEDAEDATQEILVKIITKLSSFRRESKLSTWIYRVSVNHLIDFKKSKQEEKNLKFNYIQQEILNNQKYSNQHGLDVNLYEPIVRTSCTYAMLLCLNRSYRIAFILGSIFNLKSDEAAWILEISAETYRKRLSRSKNKMNQFMKSNCGLVLESNSCRCAKRIDYAVARGNLQLLLKMSQELLNSKEWKIAEEVLEDSEEILEMEKVFRTNPKYPFRKNWIHELKEMIESKNNIIFETKKN